MFVDEAEITVKGGNGGSGCTAFLREKYRPKGGPAGGDGGRGGSVYAEAAPGLRTLVDFRSRLVLKAQNGVQGEGKSRTGKSGDDLTIQVPPGTLIRDPETGEIIADIKKPGQRALIAEGGKGGRGNARFATSTNRIPTKHEKGNLGEKKKLHLELKLIADVGTVGSPNCGKSTLIGAISTVTPKVANYPFTTLAPSVGLVSAGEFSSFTIADIPGLIEFAHKGKGLGHKFLRHLGRTQLLLQLVPLEGSNPDEELQRVIEDYSTISKELTRYGHGLDEKEKIVIISKADLASDENLLNHVADGLMKEAGLAEPPIVISSHTGEGLKKLVGIIWDRLKEDEDRWPEAKIDEIVFDGGDVQS